jgi:hypothetical protein
MRDADRRKDEFWPFSHELRNPLSPIRYAQPSRDCLADPSNKSANRIIERQVGHMSAC